MKAIMVLAEIGREAVEAVAKFAGLDVTTDDKLKLHLGTIRNALKDAISRGLAANSAEKGEGKKGSKKGAGVEVKGE
ncbi:MAG: hypothetical protein M0R66_03840 [Candidatus Omnitrophica bacterium]|nr:hypothetical protein [Candidatus Omnitrophota bacterium]